MRIADALLLGFAIFAGAILAASRNVPKDLSRVRDFTQRRDRAEELGIELPSGVRRSRD